MLGVVAGGCSSGGADAGTAPSTTAGVTTTIQTLPGTTTTAAGARVPEGFSSVVVRLTRADGTTVEWCVFLAATLDERGRGLMEVDSVGDRAGMLFDFQGSTESQFYMLMTRIPLAVGFFAEDGTFVSRADMVPCPDDDDDPLCTRYGATAPYRTALEVPADGLEQLWLEPGARLEQLDRGC